jgi:hypothetical protein
MNRFRALAAGSLLSTALVVSAPVQAMQIQVFDRMAARDQQDYVNLLMETAQKVLIEAGRQNDAAKAHQLFTEIHQGDALPIGESEFEGNLANARVADAISRLSDPKPPGLDVEDALAVTLKKNGIELPGSFFTVASKFLPPIAPTPPSTTAPPVASRPAPFDDDPIGPGGFITPPDR